MENLNDLIWTDEDENNEVSTQGSEMYRVCMIAFCTNNSATPNSTAGCIVCGDNYRSLSCLP